MACAFDAAPNYVANRVKYVRESEMTNAHDWIGKTAMDAVENVLHDKDPGLRKLWAKVTGPEDQDMGCRRTACKPKGENRND